MGGIMAPIAAAPPSPIPRNSRAPPVRRRTATASILSPAGAGVAGWLRAAARGSRRPLRRRRDRLAARR